jgi:GR25 family glycosyltransferase involved in LPS biosynthesis
LLRSNVINSAGSNLKLGQIGCWLSHLNAWQCIADAPYKFGTVFEDDVGFSNSLEISQRVQVAMTEMDQTCTNWDVLFWCVSPLPHVHAALRNCHLKNWFIVPPNQCVGCIAYTIKKSVAHMWISRAKPIHNAVDVWVSESFDRLKAFCIKPFLGFVVPSFSDTDESRNPGYLQYLK